MGVVVSAVTADGDRHRLMAIPPRVIDLVPDRQYQRIAEDAVAKLESMRPPDW